jgi:hypothetical protein
MCLFNIIMASGLWSFLKPEFPEGDSNKKHIFLSLGIYLLNCMFGRPGITVIAIGTVVVVIVIAFVCRGLKFTPEPDR